MDDNALVAIAELKKGIQQEEDGEFPHELDFHEWALVIIDKVEKAIKSAASRRI